MKLVIGEYYKTDFGKFKVTKRRSGKFQMFDGNFGVWYNEKNFIQTFTPIPLSKLEKALL